MDDKNTNYQSDSSGFNTPPPPPPPPPPQPPQGNYKPYTASSNILPVQPDINKLAGDMKFFGIYQIIAGIISCLNCVGLIWGIPIIFSGIRLNEAADALKNYNITRDPKTLDYAFERQARFFFIQKIIIIVALALSLVSVIFVLLFFGVIVRMLSQLKYYDV